MTPRTAPRAGLLPGPHAQAEHRDEAHAEGRALVREDALPWFRHQPGRAGQRVIIAALEAADLRWQLVRAHPALTCVDKQGERMCSVCRNSGMQYEGGRGAERPPA